MRERWLLRVKFYLLCSRRSDHFVPFGDPPAWCATFCILELANTGHLTSTTSMYSMIKRACGELQLGVVSGQSLVQCQVGSELLLHLTSLHASRSPRATSPGEQTGRTSLMTLLLVGEQSVVFPPYSSVGAQLLGEVSKSNSLITSNDTSRSSRKKAAN